MKRREALPADIVPDDPSDPEATPGRRGDRKAGPRAAAAPIRPACWVAVLPGVLALVAFAPCVSNGFTNHDDYGNFRDNPDYQGLGWHQVRWAATTMHLGVYQPLSWLILSAQYAAFGLDPRGYHLTSVLLHAAVALALGRAIAELLARARPTRTPAEAAAIRLGAVLAAAAFAVHPQRTEAVAWASGQMYLPSALLYLLALLAYLRAHPEGRPARTGWGLAAFGLFGLAMLAKAVGVTLALVLVILDVYPLRRIGGRAGWFGPGARRAWAEKAPFLALSLLFMILAVEARRVGAVLIPLKIDQGPLAERIAQACFAVWFYLARAVVPVGFSNYYLMPPRIALDEPIFAACAIALAAVSLGLLALRRRVPGLLAAWAAYLATLSINSGLIRSTMQLVSDRYGYLPMMAPATVLGAGLSMALSRGRGRGRAAVALAAGCLVAWTVLSWRQCATWKSSLTLWTSVLDQAERPTPELYNNLASAIEAEQGPGPAIAAYRRALGLAPHHPLIQCNLASALARVGRVDEAIAHFRAAIALAPDFPEPRAYLGIALLESGRLDEAEVQLRRAIHLNPSFGLARASLGVLLDRQGRGDEAIAQLRAAAALRPQDPGVLADLGTALARRGRWAEAETQFAAALRIQPANPDVRAKLEAVSRQRGRR